MFFGILEIEDPEWLSKKGLEYLERDIKEYDRKVHIRHITGDSGWGIHILWRQLKTERRPLKVRIGCVKNMLAHYLTCQCPFTRHYRTPLKSVAFS